MVGLSDIPCVGKIVDRISDAMVDPLFRGFNYMFCYKDHVILLESKIQQLKSETDEMSRKVGQEINNGKTIIEQVEKWQEEVEGIQKSAEEFLEKYKNRSSWRCIQSMPIPKPISRFRLGREAVHTARRVTELSNSARDLPKDVAYLPPVPNVPTPLTVFGDFQSRKDAYQKLWEALVTDGGPPVLGIYGMPGVGKTRMAEQIWKEAEEKKIFDKFARAVVGSEEVDVIKLRNQIAGHLSCKFDPQANEERRTSQLKDSIMKGETKGEKILIILDDVWREISLDSIGIPLGDGSSCKGLKILITSREETVCKHNRCKHPIKITILTNDEAWKLFRNTVVNTEYNFPDESLAKKVCNKCAGLPLLIRAVGKALQYTSQNSWKDALDQLEKGKVKDIEKIDPQVYACVKLSIDALSVDAKSCLFLCSLYPEDAEIYIRKLIQIATDTQLVRAGEYRVRNMVDILRSASLLLDCKEDHKIKLHDLIRDVARYIAVEDPEYAFSIVRMGSQLPDNVGTRKFLHLQPEKNDFRFPDNLVCPPDLHNLWMQSNRDIIPEFSSGFFCMFANLRFLLIEGGSSEMRFSLQDLCNLKALILDECNLKGTDVSFFPEKLETVCFWDCDLPVPLDLTNLTHLKKLEIQGGDQDNWDSLEELRCQHTNIFSNLSDYHIHVGDPPRYLLESSDSIKRSIELYGDGLKFEGLQSLIERAERVRLFYCRNINVGSIYNSNREAFADLRNLYMHGCDSTVEYVARIRRGEIQHHRSFSKLTILQIRYCSGMKYVFSKSVAKCLGQLRELIIQHCDEMEAIVMNEGASSDGDEDIINFSNLKSLTLWFLRRLKSFYMEEKDISAVEAQPVFDRMIQLPNLVDFQLSNCGQIDLQVIEFGRDDSTCQLRKLEVDCNNGIQLPGKWFSRLYNNLERLQLRRYDRWPQLKFDGFKRLKVLQIVGSGCSFLFSFSAFESLNQLQELEIGYCALLEEIVEDVRSGEPRTVTLLHLKSVSLLNLPKLRSCFHGANYEFHMPALEGVFVENCGISTLFSFSAFESLNQLEILVIRDCPLLEEIVEDVRSGEPRTVTLFHLKLVILKNLPELRSCFHGANYEFHMLALEEVFVENCGISTLFTCSVLRTLQQLKELRVEGCTLLEDIVEDEKGDETSDTNHNIITLPRFQKVRLDYLPNLKSFSRNSTYAFNMPVLQRIFAIECPQIENFTCLKTTTPLIYVSINGCGMKSSDPNDCVRAARDETKSSNSAGESSSSRDRLDEIEEND